MVAAEPNELESQLRALVEKISAYVEQFHGGTVEFVSLDSKQQKVRLGGGLSGLSPAPVHPARLGGGNHSSILSRHRSNRRAITLAEGRS
jgi:hypothetical protein